MTSPGVTLSATLQDLTGAAVGSESNPSTLRITLCGYGPVLPRIAGTSMLAATGPLQVESSDGSVTTPLWGNDAITPAGTFYEIALIDGEGNLVQAGMYEFANNAGAVDLSNASQLNAAPAPTFIGYQTLVNPTTPQFNGQVANNFDITLGSDVASSTAVNFAPGTFVTFFITNPASWTFAWPSNFVNPPAVTNNATTVALFASRADGSLYAI